MDPIEIFLLFQLEDEDDEDVDSEGSRSDDENSCMYNNYIFTFW